MRILIISILCGWAVGLGAKPPVLKHIYPVGAQVGTACEVEAGGTLEPWPIEFWTDHPGISVTAAEKKGTAKINVAPDVPPGAYLIAARNAEGMSAPRWFRVGTLSDQREVEPNGTLSVAHTITNLPLVIHGRLEKSDDIDHFRVFLKKGQGLSAQVHAYGLDSPVDPMLHLFDAQGVRVAFNHDAFHLDPWLVFNAEKDGETILQLSGFAHPPKADVRLTGSKETVYALTLKPEHESPQRAFPASLGDNGFPRSIRDALTQPERTYAFDAKKGERFSFQTHAARLGVAFDPVVRIFDDKKKELIRSDDTKDKRLDPVFEWSAPADGTFTLSVSDLHGRQDPSYKFQLDLQRLEPGFAAHAEAFALSLNPGKSTALKISCARIHGETNRIALVAEGMPPGVYVSAPDFPKKNGEVTMTFSAAEEQAAFQGAIRVFAVSLDEPTPRKQALVFRLKGTSTPFEDLERRERDTCWLTVPPASD